MSVKELHLIGGSSSLTFYQASPTKEIVEEFVNEVINRTRKLLLEKYGKVDPDLPEETQMNQLNWARTNDIISEEQYRELKQEYKTKRLLNH